MPQSTLTAQQQQYLHLFAEEYIRKTKSSQQRREQSWPLLADPRSSQGFFRQADGDGAEMWLATKHLRYPLVGDRCQGSQVWDIDGNQYTDFCMGFGVCLFGHRPEFLNAALRQQIERGISIGYQSDRAHAVAAAVAAMTGSERVAFCNTGAEALMYAIRLARGATGRDKIVLFRHFYHGVYDAVVPANGVTRGLSSGQLEDVLVMEYGTARTLQAIGEQADQIAGVLFEPPIHSPRHEIPSATFLHSLRKLTHEKDIPLILDDIRLGFRVHQGGSQTTYGFRADITAYGKVLGGGLPIGVVTGSSRFLDQIDGGRWSHNDDSGPTADKVRFAGTFSKNPMTIAAADAVTMQLIQAGTQLQHDLNNKTDRMAAELNKWFVAESLPIRIEHMGSMFRFASPPALWLLLPHLAMRGVSAFAGKVCFLSTAHSDRDIEQLTEAVRDSLFTMRDGGYLVRG